MAKSSRQGATRLKATHMIVCFAPPDRTTLTVDAIPDPRCMLTTPVPCQNASTGTSVRYHNASQHSIPSSVACGPSRALSRPRTALTSASRLRALRIDTASRASTASSCSALLWTPCPRWARRRLPRGNGLATAERGGWSHCSRQVVSAPSLRSARWHRCSRTTARTHEGGRRSVHWTALVATHSARSRPFQTDSCPKPLVAETRSSCRCDPSQVKSFP